MSGSNKSEKSVATIICGAPDGYIDLTQVEGLVIAADHGLDHALAAGIAPDIAVGDFDSAHSAVPDGIEVIRVSPIKDDTDAMLAADTAIERGCTHLKFLCALGGRLDHTIAAIQMLKCLENRGVSARLYGGNESAYLLSSDSVEIPYFSGYVSVFAWGGSAEVSLSGMKYPLERYTLTDSFPLGVSNEISADIARITVHSGTVLITQSKMSPAF